MSAVVEDEDILFWPQRPFEEEEQQLPREPTSQQITVRAEARAEGQARINLVGGDAELGRIAARDDVLVVADALSGGGGGWW